MNQQAPGSVPVYFPAKLWARLATVADERGVKIPDLIEASISSIATTVSFEATVEAHVKAGLPDSAIARETGELLHRVARTRRRLGLEANRMIRGASKEPTVVSRAC